MAQAPSLASLEEPTTFADVDRLTALHQQLLDRLAEAQRRIDAARADVFATVDGLDLHLPGRDILAVGFHEAREHHLTMVPQDAYRLVMPSRGREGSATSAVDIVLPPGENILAPVSGTLRLVASYALYDEYEDVLVELVPDGRPDLVITIHHLDGIRVRTGQRVEAGTTVLADSARVFDFVAQVEHWARGPHVDLRVART